MALVVPLHLHLDLRVSLPREETRVLAQRKAVTRQHGPARALICE